MHSRCILLPFMLVIVAMSAPSAATGYDIVGSKRCAVCHRSGRRGNVFDRWQRGPHAKAFTVLQTPKAKQLANGDAHRNARCLRCHTTVGALARTIGTEPGTKEGVGCEACHGAGSGYSRLAVMQDRRKALAKGLEPGNHKRCEQCHNGQCPADQSMVTEEGWRRIGHGNNIITKRR